MNMVVDISCYQAGPSWPGSAQRLDAGRLFVHRLGRTSLTAVETPRAAAPEEGPTAANLLMLARARRLAALSCIAGDPENIFAEPPRRAVRPKLYLL